MRTGSAEDATFFFIARDFIAYDPIAVCVPGSTLRASGDAARTTRSCRRMGFCIHFARITCE
jgi:hypothetical protein